MRNYLGSESGATMGEYALILAVIGGAVALATVGLRSSIGVAITGAGAAVANTGAASGSTTTPGASTNSTGETTGGSTSGGNCVSGSGGKPKTC